MKNKRIKFILLTVIFLFLIPLVAMQFTDEVNWTLMDFIIAGGLLLSTGLVFDFVLRKIKSLKYRIASLIALLIVLLLIWAELAVGIFNTPISGS